jgi:hypothetical protein
MSDYVMMLLAALQLTTEIIMLRHTLKQSK